MKSDEIIASLHALERKVLQVGPDKKLVGEISKKASLQEIEVLRAVSWLEGKGLAKSEEKILQVVNLDSNGKDYVKSSLPEQRILELEVGKKFSASEVKKKCNLSDQELNISIGTLKKDNLIDISKGKELEITVKKKEKLAAQKFIESLPLDLTKVTDKKILDILTKRKNIVKIDIEKKRTVFLTVQGKDIIKKLSSADEFIDSITPKMLRTGDWQKVRFRSFDVTSEVPRVYHGQKQPYREFLEEVRQKFLSLGFEEANGPIVESDFWNMDALFMPQFHSARDIHDAYYVKEPKYATDIPADLIKKVKAAHESGYNTGSKGWRYEFDDKRTKRQLLRTQDTAISPRLLSSKDLKVPGKYFQMVRCFRYDVIDATHLADFNQVGGFVVEKDLNLKNLFWLLKMFAEEFCQTDKVRIVPAYFPFTEPSASVYAKHPQMGWIELGGSGIFRPELTRPLGVKEPVIAWGLGIDRLAMFKLGFKDIRDLFSHDIGFLRDTKGI